MRIPGAGNALVFICDATGRLVQANAEFNRFFLENDSPRRTRTLTEYFPSEHDSRHITAALAQVLAAQESVRLEVECLKDDGARAVLAIELSPLPAPDPAPLLIACVGYDVSESRKAQAALRYRLEFEQIITRISSEFINIAPNDVDAAISDALQRIVEFTDTRCGFVFLLDEGGQSASNTHEWAREGVDSNQQELQRLALHEFPWAVEQLVKNKEPAIIADIDELPADAQGERRLLERLGVKSLVLAPMIFGGPTIGGVGLEGASKPREWTPDEIALLRFAGEVFANVLHRKQAEEQLNRSESRLRAITSSMPDYLVQVNRDGTVTYVNRAPDGYESSEIVGRAASEFVHADYQVQFEQFVEQVWLTGSSHECELVAIGSRGTHRWYSIRSNPVMIDGRVVSVLLCARDIDASKRAQTEWQKLSSRLQEAQKLESLTVMAGGIAHDFNNLLMGVLGNAGLALMDLERGAEVSLSEKLEDIVDAAQKASELIHQMVAYAGRSSLDFERVDLNSVVDELRELMRAGVPRKVELRFDCPEGLPLIDADASLVSQGVMNLVINAAEAIGDQTGTIEIRTGRLACEADYLYECVLGESLAAGEYVFLDVSDTGGGMDEAVQMRIFDPFFTTKRTGRGLGMAAVLGVARSHGGGIRLSTEAGKGATVRLLFPLAGAGRLHRSPDNRAVLDWKGSGTVLLVDDDAMVRSVAKQMLERIGFSVLTATDGLEGVETFREHADEIRLVVMDMMMPRLTGAEALTELQKTRPGVPVLLASGYYDNQTTQRWEKAGFTGFIQKPYMLEDLARKIQETLETTV